MAAVCKDCKHFSEGRGFYPATCLHPDATTVDRVRGPLHPRLSRILTEDNDSIIEETTSACDREGRFEKRRPWWVF